MRNWELTPEFLYKFVKGEIKLNSYEYYLQLLNDEGYEVRHPDYKAGGKPIQLKIRQMEEFTFFRMKPKGVTWNVSEDRPPLKVCAIAIYSEQLCERIAGVDFPQWYESEAGESITIQSDEHGIVSINNSVIDAMQLAVDDVKQLEYERAAAGRRALAAEAENQRLRGAATELRNALQDRWAAGSDTELYKANARVESADAAMAALLEGE